MNDRLSQSCEDFIGGPSALKVTGGGEKLDLESESFTKGLRNVISSLKFEMFFLYVMEMKVQALILKANISYM